MKQEKRRTSNISNGKLRMFTSSGYIEVDQTFFSKHTSYCYYLIMYSIRTCQTYQSETRNLS